jgi:hypothetical protein
MDAKKLGKIKRKIESLRRKPVGIRPRDLIALATKLGRKEVNRGKEPTYESTEFDTNVLTITKHGGDTLAPGTARSILDQLEEDVILFEQRLEDQKKEGVIHEDKHTH